MRALVTGAGGFIGSALVAALLARGYRVRAMVRRPTSFPEGVEVRFGDLESTDSLCGLASDCQWVFNAAGFAHAMSDDADRHWAVNHRGVLNLAEEARRAGVEVLVHFSSVKAEAPAADDAYGRAKREAEEALVDCGLARVAILRPALVYGPGCRGNLERMLRAVRRRLLPPLPRQRNRRSLVDLRDLVEAAMLAAERVPVGTHRYTITDGETYSTRDIQDAMYRALGREPPAWALPSWVLRVLGGVSGRLRQPVDRLLGDAWYDGAGARAELGFEPRHRLPDGLRAMLRRPA